jgi:esterase/lipase superfamily enzyme
VKRTETWHSPRLEREVTVARWGETGTPLLIFPTAGGDAEEIERFHIIDTLGEYLAEGRIKIYSCDSVAGRVMLASEGSPQHQMWMLDRFQAFVGEELVPLIRQDCRSEDIGIAAAGSSIGAFNALAVLCRYPRVFTLAICMSGTYDLQRFLKAPATNDFYVSSPVHYVAQLEGERLDALRSRFVLLASGEGRAEDIGESWRVAHELGSAGIPNRVDSWGAEWHHDWPTWRKMLRTYVGELIPVD